MNWIFLLGVLSLSACNKMNELIDGKGGTVSPPKIIDSNIFPTEAPEFNVPQPPNTVKTVYFGEMPGSGIVQVSANATVDVFIYQTGPKQWFKLKPTVSEAFYYSYNATTGVVQYFGHLGGTAYCIYEYK